jgi:hypothetical protein
MSDSNSTPFKSGTLNSPVAQADHRDGGGTPLIMSGIKYEEMDELAKRKDFINYEFNKMKSTLAQPPQSQ